MADQDDTVDHAAALTRFLEQEWKAMGTTRSRWCREHGLADSTVLRWGQGPTQIDMNQMKAVARGLGRPLVDILLAAEYLTPDQVDGRVVAPRQPMPVADAIRTDPALSDGHREALLAIHHAWLAVEAGQQEVATGSGKTAAASRPRTRRAAKR